MPTSKTRKTADGKAVKHTPDNAYAFTYEGKRYKMPVDPDAVEAIDNSIWMEAYLADDGDTKAGMRLVYAVYKASTKIPDDVRAVLNRMPAEKFAEHMGSWFQTMDASGVSMGESAPSDEG